MYPLLVQVTVLNVVSRPLPFPISDAEGQASSSSSGKGGPGPGAEPIKEDTRLKNRVLDLRYVAMCTCELPFDFLRTQTGYVAIQEVSLFGIQQA
jgi:hypothetical protein